MNMITINPDKGIYPAREYAHAMEVRGASRLLFVSGTMGLEPDGGVATGVDAQLQRVWANIRHILDEAGMGMDNIVRVTSYLRNGGDALANQQARLNALGGRLVPTTAIVVETLSPDWLVEIELIAAA